jgi:acyl-CoA dehydrogenase
MGMPSPYYKETHTAWQKACREFVDKNLVQHGMDWEREGMVPEHVFADFAAANMLLPSMPAPLPIEWLKKLGIRDILGTKVEQWDYMHMAIYGDEVR